MLKKPQRKSPLEMLIETIEDVLAIYDSGALIATIERNPFYAGPYVRFQPEVDYQHDIKLLKTQLAGLHEILAEIKE